MKKLITLLFACILSQAVHSQSQKSIDWSADLDFLARELPARHFNLFATRSEAYFQHGIEKIKYESPKLGDFHTVLKTQQLIAGMGDSHTMLNFPQLLDREKILPLGLSWTADGIYIVYTTEENKSLLGCRIEAIGNAPVTIIADSLSTLFTIDNRAIVKTIVPEFIPCLQILEYFGFTDSSQAELTLSDGRTYTLRAEQINNTNAVPFKTDSLAFVEKNRQLLFTDRYFPEEKIYYMLYNSCSSRELVARSGNKEKASLLPSFKEFEQRAFDRLNRAEVDKIIFDMRYNGGGSSSQGTEFIKKLAQFLKHNPHVSTYVVIGRKTFSSAILNAMDFKQQTNAVFVGEQTAGKPNHFGEVRQIQLPGSKLSVSYSTKYFKNTDEDIDTLTPDITIETFFSDYAKGVDPVFEWIKRQTPPSSQDRGANK